MLAMCCNLAWPQVETGTVVVFVSSQNEITVAADSRSLNSITRIHNDYSCKIRVFGDKFFFAMAGPVDGYDAAGHGWSTYTESKAAWRRAVRNPHMVSSAQKLTNDVAEHWINSMDSHQRDYRAIMAIRDTIQAGNALASAIFGATDSAGNLGLTRATILIDLDLLDKKKVVRLTHEIVERPKLGDGGTLGLGEIAAQYAVPTTVRIRQGIFSPSAQDAEIARKLVELTIQLHPRKEMLGGEIDELQLWSGVGVTWISRKNTCKEQE